MQPLMRTFRKQVAEIFRDTLLQRLILFVIAASLFFVLVIGTDPPTTLGLLVLGLVTAFLESAHHRKLGEQSQASPQATTHEARDSKRDSQER